MSLKSPGEASALSVMTEAIEVRREGFQIASETDVSTALQRIASEATVVLAQENPIVLAVMQGGVFTAVELCRRFDFPHEFDFIHVTRYEKSLMGGELSWRAFPNLELSGRMVLLVDDILDQGVTLAALYQELIRSGVSQLYSAVLVSKNLERSGKRINVDFVGMEVEDAYVFGCGMDYKGYWRGLRELDSVNSL
ncbi:MAG: hypoxanthine-guanine phosphoribosyltransferase [Pseudomonadota bacterium]|nr:hypoxanthine-guanine phosphoribosyltransferase [Pseudomonadota bacterium]